MASGCITEEYHRTHKHSDLVVHVDIKFTVYNLPYVYKSLNLTEVDKDKDTTTLHLPVNEVKCHFISHVRAELNKRLITNITSHI